MIPESRAESRTTHKVRVAAFVVALLVVVLSMIAIIFLYGRVGETHFSPDRFRFRGQTYYEIPILEIRVTPRSSVEYSKPGIEYLETHGFIPRAGYPGNRWEFVHGHKTGYRGWIGLAKPAKNVLTHDYLFEWSVENPELAKNFWPRIVENLRRERYEVVHHLHHWALAYEGDPARFDEYMAEQIKLIEADLPPGY